MVQFHLSTFFESRLSVRPNLCPRASDRWEMFWSRKRYHMAMCFFPFKPGPSRCHSFTMKRSEMFKIGKLNTITTLRSVPGIQYYWKEPAELFRNHPNYAAPQVINVADRTILKFRSLSGIIISYPKRKSVFGCRVLVTNNHEFCQFQLPNIHQ
jgi:hypothetical protein